MATDDSGAWVTVREAARRLGRSARTIQRMASAGTLPAKRQGKRLFVDIGAIADTDQAERRDDDADSAAKIARLTTIVEQLTQERDYLMRLLDREQELRAMSLTPTRQIAPPSRPWWKRIFDTGE
jgi:excisionase family DNA binding protein